MAPFFQRSIFPTAIKLEGRGQGGLGLNGPAINKRRTFIQLSGIQTIKFFFSVYTNDRLKPGQSISLSKFKVYFLTNCVN